MWLNRKQQGQRGRQKQTLIQFLWLPLLAVILCGSVALGAVAPAPNPNYVPLERDSVVALLQKTVEVKMLPYVIKNEGLTLTVTKLQHLAMDWNKSQFTLRCSFEASYNKLGSFKESGEIALVGTGLLSSQEQKMGMRILSISDLKLKGLLGQFSSAIQMVADKSLAGKEFWFGDTPLTSEMLTADNFETLVEVALAQQMPWTGAADNTTFTFTKLHKFEMLPQAGKVAAGFDMEGTRKGWMFKKFSGQAAVEVEVWINPDELAGMIKINKITELKLDNTPGMVEGIIKGLVNAKVKGNELPFSWK